MSRLMKKALKADKKKKKKLPTNVITAVFTKVDNVSLRKAKEITGKCYRGLKTVGGEMVNVALKGVNRRLDNVLRTSQNVMTDLAALAGDATKTIPKDESKSVNSKLKTYKGECDSLVDTGSRILRTIKKDFPTLNDQGFQRIIKVYQTKSKQIDKVFNRIDKYLDLLGGTNAEEEESDETREEDIDEMDED